MSRTIPAPTAQSRTLRLVVKVSAQERSMIVAKAKVAGLSMSAYVRRCALDDDAGDSEKAALAQVDAIIIGMESALDSATSALDAVLERLDATQ